MAENDINRSRFNEFLVRLFGMETFPPAAQLATEIVPVMEVEPYALENYWLASQRLCCAVSAIGATALEIDAARLRNPAGSGIVAAIETIIVSGAAAQEVTVGPFPTTLDMAIPSGVNFRDGRIRGLPACQVSHQSAVGSSAGANNLFRAAILAYTPVVLPVGIAVLQPGRAVDVQFDAINVFSRVTWWWRERALADVENPPR